MFIVISFFSYGRIFIVMSFKFKQVSYIHQSVSSESIGSRLNLWHHLSFIWHETSKILKGLNPCSLHDHILNNLFVKLPQFFLAFLQSAGSLCHCLLPTALQVPAVRHDHLNFPHQPREGEKTRLRNAFTCLSSISLRQKSASGSSLFLHSSLRDGLRPWELRRSNTSLKKRWKFLLQTGKSLGYEVAF